jgi:hypothetical protein
MSIQSIREILGREPDVSDYCELVLVREALHGIRSVEGMVEISDQHTVTLFPGSNCKGPCRQTVYVSLERQTFTSSDIKCGKYLE